jgi:fused signal recognition particle receptor
MDPTLIAVVVVAIVAIAAFLVFRANGNKQPELPPVQPKPELPPKDGDTLKAKLEEKRAEQQKSKDERTKPADEGDGTKQADQKAAEARKAAEEAARLASQKEAAEKAASEEAKKAEAKRAEEAKKAAEAKKPETATPAEAAPAAQAAREALEASKPAEAKAASESAPEKRPVVALASAPHKRDVEGVRRGVDKSVSGEGFFGRLASLIRRKELPASLIDELQEVLLTSDVGTKTTDKLLEQVRAGLNRGELQDGERVWEALRIEAKKILEIGGGGVRLGANPTIVMMVGVNGAGKTTTIGKIATKLTGDGKKVVLAAGDTFRAAAVQQLEVWGKRVNCEVVRGKDGADPAGVVFDAIQKARALGSDVVLCDTAGRLHTKTPLMDELRKIARSVNKAMEGAPHETLLVIDATNGQNALAQARQFSEALPLTGIILTKLDGTAKGGVILSICDELKVPVRYIGLGERSDDLHDFDADEYVEAVFGAFGRGAGG